MEVLTDVVRKLEICEAKKTRSGPVGAILQHAVIVGGAIMIVRGVWTL